MGAGESFLECVKTEVESHLQAILTSELHFEFAALEYEEAGARGAIVPLLNELFQMPELALNAQQIETVSPRMLVNRL